MSFFYQNNKERLRLYTSLNNTFASHLHKQVELIIVLEGQLIVTSDQSKYTLTANQGVIIFPNRLHSLYTDMTYGSRILLAIFEPGFCPHYRQYFQNYCAPKYAFDLNQISEHGRLSADRLLELTSHINRREQIPAYICNLAEGYLSLLFADLFTAADDAPIKLQQKKDKDYPELEQRLLQYLDSHFTESVSLELLSKEFGISRFQISRIFSDKFQTSLPQYINSRRLEYARELLMTTELSVIDIAMDSGFGSSRSFFREFKDAFHMTPNVYRRQHTR